MTDRKTGAEKAEAGKIGEVAAGQYLHDNGYLIQGKNYRVGRFEVDLIALKEKTLIFIEVKTRTSELFGYPEEAVTYQKENNIRKASGAYLHQTKYQGEIRYDIIAVILDRALNVKSIFHIEDAFFPGPW